MLLKVSLMLKVDFLATSDRASIITVKRKPRGVTDAALLAAVVTVLERGAKDAALLAAVVAVIGERMPLPRPRLWHESLSFSHSGSADLHSCAPRAPLGVSGAGPEESKRAVGGCLRCARQGSALGREVEPLALPLPEAPASGGGLAAPGEQQM
mmetsp:Transcript_65567/g.170696  ORF Transcript_65567/g.170696 Transcript_65567/m.170696 type:complete len:154 (+) Transcript_65567:628-1089(+)